MTYNTGAAARSRLDPTSSDADNVDRILLAACAVIWLAALGSAVAADGRAGRSRQRPSGVLHRSSGTPWLLYGVIGVSALVIVGAIPLLVRARRAALDDPRAGRGAGARPATGRTQTPARAAEPRDRRQLRTSQPAAAADRQRSAYPSSSRSQHVRRRATARGGPAVAALRRGHRVRHGRWRCWRIGIATYLMAAGHDTFSWAAYVVAGLVTLAMPAIPWIYLRQLRDSSTADACARSRRCVSGRSSSRGRCEPWPLEPCPLDEPLRSWCSRNAVSALRSAACSASASASCWSAGSAVRKLPVPGAPAEPELVHPLGYRRALVLQRNRVAVVVDRSQRLVQLDVGTVRQPLDDARLDAVLEHRAVAALQPDCTSGR